MISEEEFKELAMLSRLDPEDKDLKGLRGDFNKILDFVDKINEIDTSSSADITTPNETLNVTRADEPQKTLESHVISSFAPEWEAGHFVVPGAIESEN